MTATDPEQLLERAVTLHRAGKTAPVEALYRSVLAAVPDHARALHNLGLLLLDRGDAVSALPLLERAVVVDAARSAFWNTLGRARSALDDGAAAVAAFERALALDADNVDAWINLGNQHLSAGHPNAAANCYETVLRKRSDIPEALLGLGGAWAERGDHARAVGAFTAALRAFPGIGDIHGGLARSLLHVGRFDEALHASREALRLGLAHRDRLSALLFSLLYLPHDPRESLAAARRYGESCRTHPSVRETGDAADPERRLRLGYVSGDFGEHAVGHFIAPLLRHHDPAVCDVHCYDTHSRTDALATSLRSLGWHWRSLADVSDADAAGKIRADRIDILIDLSGHTRGHRLPLFAHRPAPLQIAWFGYRGSRGVAEIDRMLVTPRLLPPDEAKLIIERPLYLPRAFMCFDPLVDRPIEVMPPPAVRNGHVTFGSFHNLTKLHPDTLRCWARILHECPDARLHLKTRDLEQPAARRRIVDAFAAHDVGEQRLLLEGASPRREYYAAFNHVDITLDPFPYRGGAVTFQSLWMGVPVLTLEQPLGLIGHFGAAILDPLGLDDWIARDEDDYVRRACRLAADIHSLADLRAGLRDHLLASPAGDGLSFVRQLEQVLRGAWREWCAAR